MTGAAREMKRCSTSSDTDRERKTSRTISKPLCGDGLTMKRCHKISDTDRKGKRCGTSSDTDRDRKKSRTSSDTDREKKKSRTISKPLCGDRLSSLPNQTLGQILSLLPTKDVGTVQGSSKRMGHVFSLIASIDLDDSPTCHCRNAPLLLERFPLFKSFVSKVLLQAEEPLTRFRLRFGGDKTTHVRFIDKGHTCSTRCFPNVEPSRLNVWLSYPLAHSGLRELELTFRLSNPNDCKLPPQLFDFRLLESFKVDANIKINGADITLICLPNLKLMDFHLVVFTEDDFVSRLVSSCPALEELNIYRCCWEEFDRMTIASHSLQRMVLCLSKVGTFEAKRTHLVTIDTPNLQYLYFTDYLPYHYSVTRMNVLVEAKLFIYDAQFDDVETSVQSQLSLLSAFTEVQHFTLDESFLETMFLVAELENHLPVFRNLRTITLPPGRIGEWRWDILLLLILHSSPLLETLVFRRGIFYLGFPSLERPAPDHKEEAFLEAEGWRTNTLPSGCLGHLKRIEFGICFGIDRELNMIKFFLGKASCLKELVLCLCKDFDHPLGCRFPVPNFEEFVSKLEELPRASNSCSIIVRPAKRINQIGFGSGPFGGIL